MPSPARRTPPDAGRLVERLLMGLLIGGIAIGCGFVLYPFLSALLWAGILVFCTWPVFQWLCRRARLPKAVAASVMVVLAAVLVVLPLALAAPGGADEATQLRQSITAWLAAGLPPAPDWLRAVPLFGPAVAGYWDAWSADLTAAESFFRPYFGQAAELALGVLLGVAGGIIHFVLALFIGFFFWLSGDRLGTHLLALTRRVAGPQADRLIAVTAATVRGTVYGILGTALLQGILTGFGLYITGVPQPVLLGALAGFIAVLPVGAPVVWIPAAIWLGLRGHLAAGIVLATYGVVAVSGVDHLIRPYFIARGAKLPFLLTVLGVLGGVVSFGMLGVFLGPVLLGVGLTLVLEFARPSDGARAPGPTTPA